MMEVERIGKLALRACAQPYLAKDEQLLRKALAALRKHQASRRKDAEINAMRITSASSVLLTAHVACSNASLAETQNAWARLRLLALEVLEAELQTLREAEAPRATFHHPV